MKPERVMEIAQASGLLPTKEPYSPTNAILLLFASRIEAEVLNRAADHLASMYDLRDDTRARMFAAMHADAVRSLIKEKPRYTTGHCKHKKEPGGCPWHNLQCGWPTCDRIEEKPE